MVDDPALPDRLHLRVEVQHLIRLGVSNAICFLVRTYMLSLRELATVPEWRERFAAVLAELPDDMADYKGLTRFRAAGGRLAHRRLSRPRGWRRAAVHRALALKAAYGTPPVSL